MNHLNFGCESYCRYDPNPNLQWERGNQRERVRQVQDSDSWISSFIYHSVIVHGSCLFAHLAFFLLFLPARIISLSLFFFFFTWHVPPCSQCETGVFLLSELWSVKLRCSTIRQNLMHYDNASKAHPSCQDAWWYSETWSDVSLWNLTYFLCLFPIFCSFVNIPIITCVGFLIKAALLHKFGFRENWNGVQSRRTKWHINDAGGSRAQSWALLIFNTHFFLISKYPWPG